MPAYNLDINFENGTILAVGKDGRRYGMRELEAAERAAAAGDPAAAALLRDVDLGVGEDGAPLSEDQLRAVMDRLVHDCPECQAARARGEDPVVLTPADLEALRAGGWPDGAAGRDAADDHVGPPLAWTASDLISFRPGRTLGRRRARVRRRRHRA